MTILTLEQVSYEEGKQRLIGRCVTGDKVFRELALDNPGKALAEMGLEMHPEDLAELEQNIADFKSRNAEAQSKIADMIKYGGVTQSSWS